MSIRTLNLRRILVYTASLSLLGYFALTWANMIVDHYERTGSDFMGFYSFGRISEERGIRSIYDLEAQQELQERVVGHAVTPIFYTHLPLIAPLSMAISDEDYVASFQRWAIVLLLLNAFNIYLLIRLLDLHRLSKENLVILAAGAYLFDPTFSGLMNGQDTALVLLGAALWASGFFSRKYWLAGLGLSLTVFRPQIALFLAIPFFFHHRRVFWGFVVASAVLALISLALLGYEGTLSFISAIRYIENTVWLEAHALDMPTISGLVRRYFTVSDAGVAKGLVWTGYGLGILGFSALWRRSAEIDERHLGLIATASLFLVPYAHYHDLILLLIPIFCLLRLLQRQALVHENYLAVIPLVISWLLALGFAGSGTLKFPIVHAVMLALAYLLLSRSRPAWRPGSPLAY